MLFLDCCMILYVSLSDVCNLRIHCIKVHKVYDSFNRWQWKFYSVVLVTVGLQSFYVASSLGFIKSFAWFHFDKNSFPLVALPLCSPDNTADFCWNFHSFIISINKFPFLFCFNGDASTFIYTARASCYVKFGYLVELLRYLF